ncbi:MAG: hypothetical protein NW206_20020 [Hyphomonadaceae bacterium]|nr:hypothetical protein [Hyphomonadaceae bacterium]
MQTEEIQTAEDLETFLWNCIGNQDCNGEPMDGVDTWTRYEEAGVLTTDRGLVIRTRSGAEFQVTIVRSR